MSSRRTVLELGVALAIASLPGEAGARAPGPAPALASSPGAPVNPFRVTIIPSDLSPEQRAQLVKAIEDISAPWPLGEAIDGAFQVVRIGDDASFGATIQAFVPKSWTTTTTGFRGPVGDGVAAEVTFEVVRAGICHEGECLRGMVEHLAQDAVGRRTPVRSWSYTEGRFATFHASRAAEHSGLESEQVLVVLAARLHPSSDRVVLARATAPARCSIAMGPPLGSIVQTFQVLPGPATPARSSSARHLRCSGWLHTFSRDQPMGQRSRHRVRGSASCDRGKVRVPAFSVRRSGGHTVTRTVDAFISKWTASGGSKRSTAREIR